MNQRQEPMDTSLANAVQKLKEKYAKQLAERKCVIHLEAKHAPPMNTLRIPVKLISNCAVVQQEAPKQVIPVVSKPVTVTEHVPRCQATKMDGNKCTAKAKCGSTFCGRHLPKH